eukprot:SAG22_NODE_910_length_6547_cov_2.044975_4_plen_166_part_00
MQAPKPGQLTWSANPEREHRRPLPNRTAAFQPTRSGKGMLDHTVHTTAPDSATLGGLYYKSVGGHDWSMSGRAECFEELYDGGYAETDEGSVYDASYGVRGPDEPAPEMQTNSQEIGSWSKCVATPEERALERFKVRTTDNEQKREIQQKRQGRPVRIGECCLPV